MPEREIIRETSPRPPAPAVRAVLREQPRLAVFTVDEILSFMIWIQWALDTSPSAEDPACDATHLLMHAGRSATDDAMIREIAERLHRSATDPALALRLRKRYAAARDAVRRDGMPYLVSAFMEGGAEIPVKRGPEESAVLRKVFARSQSRPRDLLLYERFLPPTVRRPPACAFAGRACCSTCFGSLSGGDMEPCPGRAHGARDVADLTVAAAVAHTY